MVFFTDFFAERIELKMNPFFTRSINLYLGELGTLNAVN